MKLLRQACAHLRLAPFIIGGALYAVVYGSCDYNYWGAWVHSLRDLLDLPFSTLLTFAARQAANPESSRLAFFHFAALLMNAHVYGFLLSLAVARFMKMRPNQALLPTSAAVTTAADAPVAPTAAAADK